MSAHRLQRIRLASWAGLAAVAITMPFAGPARAQEAEPHTAHRQHEQHEQHEQHQHQHQQQEQGTGWTLQTGADAPRHVAPPPPTRPLPEVPHAEMSQAMEMHDDAVLAMLRLDRLEHFDGDDVSGTAWDAQGWVGGDFDKLWFKTEGERADGRTEDARAELLWDHAFATWWDWQLGVRRDFGEGPGRNWAAFGIAGLAPYWFELQATAYVGEQGRTALRFEADYELLLTQRLILQPRLEANAYGKADPQRGIGAGLADAEVGLRLRYEIRRRFAPYLGIEWVRRFGATASLARDRGEPAMDRRWVAGVRVWF